MITIVSIWILILTVWEAKTLFSTFLILDKSPTVDSNSINCVQTFLASVDGRVSADKTRSNSTRVLLSSKRKYQIINIKLSTICVYTTMPVTKYNKLHLYYLSMNFYIFQFHASERVAHNPWIDAARFEDSFGSADQMPWVRVKYSCEATILRVGIKYNCN